MSVISFLQDHMLTCPSKALLHIDCPGCGMQRSIICLFKGDVAGSLTLHPATIPLLILFLFTPLHLIFRFRKGAGIIIALQIVVAVLSVTFYVYKFVHHKIAA